MLGYHLVVQWDATAVAFSPGEFYIGRSVSCFLRLDDPLVSRLHLRITVGRQVLAEDLDSTNGTQLNGERLTSVQSLSDGDQLLVGNRLLTVRLLAPGSMDVEQEQLTPHAGTRPERTMIHSDARSTRPGVGDEPAVAIDVEQRCPRCKATVPAHAGCCPHCGSPLSGAVSGKAATRPENSRVHAPEREAQSTAQRTHQSTTQSTHQSTARSHESAAQGQEATGARSTVHYRSSSLTVNGALIRLTPTGAFIDTKLLDLVGSSCTLEMEDGVVLRGFVRAVIRRGVNEVSGMGVDFVGLDAAARKWIEEHLDRPA